MQHDTVKRHEMTNVGNIHNFQLTKEEISIDSEISGQSCKKYHIANTTSMTDVKHRKESGPTKAAT